MKSLTDELFTKEFRILWQNSDPDNRKKIRAILESYFGQERAYHIILTMQEDIE